ncbi:MAG: hypothetical protein QOH79_1229 [Acidimicrobiaceae bacterium]
MVRGLSAGLVALGLLTACSGGSGSSAKTTTTSTTTSTSSTVVTISTTDPQDAVKQAYLDYWAILDRLAAAPDPGDPALAQRAIDPVFSSVQGDLSTRKAQGRTTRIPPNSKYAHHIQSAVVHDTTASLTDCYVDDRVQFSADGAVINDHVSTLAATVTLVQVAGDWKVSDVQIEKRGDGDLGCAG